MFDFFKGCATSPRVFSFASCFLKSRVSKDNSQPCSPHYIQGIYCPGKKVGIFSHVFRGKKKSLERGFFFQSKQKFFPTHKRCIRAPFGSVFFFSRNEKSGTDYYRGYKWTIKIAHSPKGLLSITWFRLRDPRGGGGEPKGKKNEERKKRENRVACISGCPCAKKKRGGEDLLGVRNFIWRGRV